MNKFISTAKGMFGYYICLYDDDGPVCRLEDWDYPTADECAEEAEKLADAYNVRFLR